MITSSNADFNENGFAALVRDMERAYLLLSELGVEAGDSNVSTILRFDGGGQFPASQYWVGPSEGPYNTLTVNNVVIGGDTTNALAGADGVNGSIGINGIDGSQGSNGSGFPPDMISGDGSFVNVDNSIFTVEPGDNVFFTDAAGNAINPGQEAGVGVGTKFKVTAVVPPPPSLTLSGDVTGLTSANTVVKIQNYNVANTNPDTNNNNLGGSLLVYSAAADIWQPVKVFASASGTAPNTSIQGGMLCGVYKTGGERTIGSTDGISDGSTGYVLNIQSPLNVVDARPIWTRDIILGERINGEYNKSSSINVKGGTDFTNCANIKIVAGYSANENKGRITMSDGSQTVVYVDICPELNAPTGGWTSYKKLYLKEISVYEGGTASKMMILASDTY